MPLENTVDSLDSIDEKYQAFYSEKEGKFELDENLRVSDPSEELLNAKNREKEARKAAEAKAMELEEQIEADKLKFAEAQGNKDEIERLKQEALDRQKAAHDAELSESKKLIHDLTIGRTLDKIASEVYINPDVINLSSIEERIKLSEDGKSTYITNKLGETITMDVLIEELRADESMAFAIKAKSGSGGGGGPKGGGDGSSKPYSEMTMEEKKAYIAAKNQ